MHKSRNVQIVYNSMFIVISLLLAFFGRIPVIPILPFLKLDFSDVPVFLSTLIFGAPSGAIVIFLVSFLRAVMFSSSGWIGFIIRILTLIIVLGIDLFWNNKKFKMTYRILGTSFSILICLAIKLIFNYFFWINFFAFSPVIINKLMLTVILPYNLIKLILSMSMAVYLKNHILLRQRFL